MTTKQAVAIPLAAALIGGACALTGAWVGATWARTNTELTIASTRQQSVAETVRPVCTKMLRDIEATRSFAEGKYLRIGPIDPSEFNGIMDSAEKLSEAVEQDEVEWRMLTDDPDSLRQAPQLLYTALDRVYFFYTNAVQTGKHDLEHEATVYEGIRDAASSLGKQLSTRCRAESGLPPR